MGVLTVDKRIFDKLIEVLGDVEKSGYAPEQRQRLEKLLKLMPQAMGGSAKAFSEQIRKLVDAGNADRAVKLTQAAKDSAGLQPWVLKSGFLLIVGGAVAVAVYLSLFR